MSKILELEGYRSAVNNTPADFYCEEEITADADQDLQDIHNEIRSHQLRLDANELPAAVELLVMDRIQELENKRQRLQDQELQQGARSVSQKSSAQKNA